MMENHYFNGQTWANFGDEGNGYLIQKYHFQTINTAGRDYHHQYHHDSKSISIKPC